jgi:hypothetical protein
VEKTSTVRHKNPLRAPDEVVQLLDRGVVVVVVEAAETDEERVRRPQLGEKLAASGGQALEDRRQQPLPHDFLRQRVLAARRRCGVDPDSPRGDDAEFAPALRVEPHGGDLGPVTERLRGRSDHVASSRLGRGQGVNQRRKRRSTKPGVTEM